MSLIQSVNMANNRSKSELNIGLESKWFENAISLLQAPSNLD